MPTELSLISSIWTQRSLGIELPQDIESLTSVDVEYVCDNFYPFLQLINSEAVFSEETSIKFTTTSTGWVIHDYGDAISTSLPHTTKGKERGGTMGQIAAASEIANLIATKGWAAVELIAGTPMMQRFLWIESKRYGFDLKGYEPDAGDEKCYERLMKSAKANGIAWEKRIPEKPRDELSVSGAS